VKHWTLKRSAAGAASSSLSALAAAASGSTGQGVTVGIISDSFDALGGAALDEAGGQLPTAGAINILKDDPTGTDEGRAIAQLVHAIAPNAGIDFYSGDFGQADFAAGIAALRAAGANVIVDDLSYPNEPFYQLGSPIDRAIHNFVAGGGTYVTAAGNAGPLSFYEGSFAGGTTDLPGVGSVTAMNFGTADAPTYREPMSVTGGDATTIDLQWAQPWLYGGGAGSAYSLAVALYGPRGKLVRTFAADAQGGNPVQIGTFTPPRSGVYSVAIYANDGTDPGGLFKIVGDNNADPPVIFAGSSGSGSDYGHVLSPAAITVGADDYLGSPSLGGTPSAEDFSSSGPGELLFSPNGQAPPNPVGLTKTDVAGPDGFGTTVPNISPFFGTSAAAAAVAADAALLLQDGPGLTARQIRRILALSATPDGSPLQSGAGLVDPQTALGEILRNGATASLAESPLHVAAQSSVMPAGVASHPTLSHLHLRGSFDLGS
jgi:hypothetical protein